MKHYKIAQKMKKMTTKIVIIVIMQKSVTQIEYVVEREIQCAANSGWLFTFLHIKLKLKVILNDDSLTITQCKIHWVNLLENKSITRNDALHSKTTLCVVTLHHKWWIFFADNEYYNSKKTKKTQTAVK